MPAFVPQSVDETVEAVRTTAPIFVKGRADLTHRRRIIPAMIKKYGREMFNQGGTTTTWQGKIRDGKPTAIDSFPMPNFAPIDRHIQFSLPVRGYQHGDSMTYKERLMNQNAGGSKLIDQMNAKVEDGTADFAKFFAGEYFIDGEATGNENRFHGRKSFLRWDDSTCQTGDKIAVPQGSYAGQSIELESNGGTWSSSLSTLPNSNLGKDWPEGNGTADYDATSPLIINITSDAWTPDGFTTWRQNAESILNWTNHIQSARGARESRTMDEAPILCLMTPVMRHDFEMGQLPKFRINVELKEMVDLGFPNAINYSGMVLDSDREVPPGEFHQISPGTMEASYSQDGYWHFDGPIDLKDQMRYVFNWFSYGNYRFQPKAEAMGAEIA